MYLSGVFRPAGGLHGFLVVVGREVVVRDLREKHFEDPDVKPSVVLALLLTLWSDDAVGSQYSKQIQTATSGVRIYT